MEGDPSLIALHSVKGAGKDTTFRFIEKWCASRSQPLSAVRRGFADKAKWAYMRQWVPNCTEQWAIDFVDQWKNDPEATAAGIFIDDEEGITLNDSRLGGRPVINNDERDSPVYFIPPVNFRQHMAQFATESARDLYGLDHWADQVLPLGPTDRNPEGWRGNFMVPPRTVEDDPYSFAHFAVMTDMRFENELLRVRELGGLNVKIKRRDAEQAVIEEAARQNREVHESELGLPDQLFDVILDNNDNNMDMAYIRTAKMIHEVDYNGIASIKRGVPIPLEDLMRHGFSADVLADSLTPTGVRATTMVATLPRPYLAELNTHRLISRDGYEQELSRNSASSRAIPTEKNIDNVRQFPYVPETFNERIKGMGVGKALDSELQQECRKLWLRGMAHATTIAEALNELGLDKSRANRIIEPFMWHTVIMTATEWENFIALRCPDGDVWDPEFPAQPEMQMFAIKVRDALAGSKPKTLEEGSWAMPYFDWDEESELLRGLMGGLAVPINELINAGLLVSSRRVARVSFEKQDDAEALMESYDKGVVLAQMSHYSPMEHQVRPITEPDLRNGAVNRLIHVPMDLFRDHRTVTFKKLPRERMWCGNLRGVIQFRKLLPYEDNAGVKRAMEAAKRYEQESAS